MQNSPVVQYITDEVRAQMARSRVAQLELADRTGIAQSTLSRRLNPRKEEDTFRIGELETIADALGVPVSQFFTGLSKVRRRRTPVGAGVGAPIHYYGTPRGRKGPLSLGGKTSQQPTMNSAMGRCVPERSHLAPRLKKFAE